MGDPPEKKTPRAAADRLVHLDALRGIAATSVMVYHHTSRFDQHFGHQEGLLFSWPYGGLGVELFFGISGFVIFMTLERTRAVLDFAWKRFTRLYPAYWASVALTFTVVAIFGLPKLAVTPMQAVANLTMLNRPFGIPYVDGAYWSLFIELVFYGWMATLFYLGALRRLHATLLAFLALSLLPAVAERILGDAAVPDLAKGLVLTGYFTFFAVGMITYRVRQRGWEAADALVIVLALASLLVAEDLWYTLVGTTICTFFVLCALYPVGLLRMRWLVFLGTISYPLYLVHQNIGYVIIRGGYETGLGPNANIALSMLSAILLATAITFGVEQPARGWLNALRHIRATGARARG